jgi:hypothetical protein
LAKVALIMDFWLGLKDDIPNFIFMSLIIPSSIEAFS